MCGCVRLCGACLGGSKYVKQSELSREVLLRYAIQKGDVVPVTLFTVAVEPLAGGMFDVTMEEEQNSAKQLQLLIQEDQGTPRFSQALFLLSKNGKTEEASKTIETEEASETDRVAKYQALCAHIEFPMMMGI